jgi:4-carboxymuconolactone decarboxylase
VIHVTEFGVIRSRRDIRQGTGIALFECATVDGKLEQRQPEGSEGRSTQLAQERLPKPVQDFRKRYPEVWKAFNELGDRCHAAGPLDEKTRRLVKVALSIGAGLEGATHSAIRNARRAGITQDEINHVAVLAVSTLGLPAAIRAFTWIGDTSRH